MIHRQRLFALIRKETTQLIRDPRTLLLILSLPVILLFLFAYAVSLTVDHIPTALVDQSQDEQSRSFVRALVNSGSFDVNYSLENEKQLVEAIDAGKVKAGVLIPPDFSEAIAHGNANVLILLDGSDSFSVQSGYNAASAITQTLGFDLVAQKLSPGGSPARLPVMTSTRVLYNPDLNDLMFILPGLIAMLVQNVIVSHASMAVVREREAGTMEQLLVTPARPLEMLLA